MVIRDTLDTDLNIFTVTPGVMSHSGEFRMYGPRVLEWTFNNILLPDSNVNEPESHGFVTYTVDQVPNLPNGTTITNSAAIYFDFNPPVITNLTTHLIHSLIQSPFLGMQETTSNDGSNVFIYPNPTTGIVHVEIEGNVGRKAYHIFEISGRQIKSGNFLNAYSQLDISTLKSGIYFISVEGSKPVKIIRN